VSPVLLATNSKTGNFGIFPKKQRNLCRPNNVTRVAYMYIGLLTYMSYSLIIFIIILWRSIMA